MYLQEYLTLKKFHSMLSFDGSQRKQFLNLVTSTFLLRLSVIYPTIQLITALLTNLIYVKDEEKEVTE